MKYKIIFIDNNKDECKKMNDYYDNMHSILADSEFIKKQISKNEDDENNSEFTKRLYSEIKKFIDDFNKKIVFLIDIDMLNCENCDYISIKAVNRIIDEYTERWLRKNDIHIIFVTKLTNYASEICKNEDYLKHNRYYNAITKPGSYYRYRNCPNSECAAFTDKKVDCRCDKVCLEQEILKIMSKR